jgi:hypothetical protein
VLFWLGYCISLRGGFSVSIGILREVVLGFGKLMYRQYAFFELSIAPFISGKMCSQGGLPIVLETGLVWSNLLWHLFSWQSELVAFCLFVSSSAIPTFRIRNTYSEIPVRSPHMYVKVKHPVGARGKALIPRLYISGCSICSL